MKKIFFADDDADDTELFSEAMKEINTDAEIIFAGNGSELIRMMETNVPPPADVIFLDLNMPKMDGYKCLLQMKQHELYKNFPVVILTTSTSQRDIDKTYNAGANFFMPKPGKFEDLKKALNFILSSDLTKQAPKEKYLIKY